jgi:hypothetical protein
MHATDALRNAPTDARAILAHALPHFGATHATAWATSPSYPGATPMNQDLAVAVRLNRLKLELERLKLANALGVKVAKVTDGMVCLERAQGQRNVRYVLAK